MSRVWLSLGANIGDPAAQLDLAIEALDALDSTRIVQQSSKLVTPPWGKTDQGDFHNMAVEIETGLSPEDLLDAINQIEADFGRVRAEKWGPRIIDIDIIAYERLLMSTARLDLPHRHAHERDFVLDPLREISSETADWVLAMAPSV